MSRSTLIVGIGSSHGDDRFGWLAMESPVIESSQRVDVRMARSPSDLLDWMDDVERLMICDVCRGAGVSDAVQRWIWPAANIEQTVFSGTHDLNLPNVLQLAAELGRLPAEVVVWSIEAKRIGPCEMASPQIAAAATEVARRILSELDSEPRPMPLERNF